MSPHRSLRRAPVALTALAALLLGLGAPADAAPRGAATSIGVYATCTAPGERAPRTTYFLLVHHDTDRRFRGVRQLLRFAARRQPRRTRLATPGGGTVRLRDAGEDLQSLFFFRAASTRRPGPRGDLRRLRVTYRTGAGLIRQRVRFVRMTCDGRLARSARGASAAAAAVAAAARAGAAVGAARPVARPAAAGVASGVYRGRAKDGTQVELRVADGQVLGIHAFATIGALDYRLTVPDTRLDASCSFDSREHPTADQRWNDFAVIAGRCLGGDRITGYVTDRAGRRPYTATWQGPLPTPRVGRYVGTIRTNGEDVGEIRFTVKADGTVTDGELAVREGRQRAKLRRGAVGVACELTLTGRVPVTYPFGIRLKNGAVTGGCDADGRFSGVMTSTVPVTFGVEIPMRWTAAPATGG